MIKYLGKLMNVGNVKYYLKGAKCETKDKNAQLKFKESYCRFWPI
jgi:hypothetical protein